ncbi:hypothetical protein FSARC_4265 [Fusarium sarcochroum]|uniref:Nucleoside phosphorylase domain-containing protein n=1 Tax=Fusarium sarcochroum TaxID=1208366 RepID=A0A8H4U2L0_9HYPO|nr:hypothetical protein FSARC_4265 [Fusarium sarcochroum]
MLTRPNDRRDFEVAIICALPLEADAVRALFDHDWDDYGQGPPFGKAPGDPNAYSTGAIGRHNVVLVHLPGMGKVSAATVASSCRTSFPGIKLALVVGVCGVVPFGSNGEEILLGDVIVSDSIAQYDFGRQLPDRFAPKASPLDLPGRPNPEIRGLLRKLKTIQGQQELVGKTVECINILCQIPQLRSTYPGSANDRLFEADYLHREEQKSCEEIGCHGKLVLRHRLETTRTNHIPAVHFGAIASGDTVMKSGQERDKLAENQGVIAFEMEGIGFWDVFPCLVIKGACDYADSHKSKIWQRYAAATAAACTKAFLTFWAPSNMALSVRSAKAPRREPAFLVPFDRNDLFVSRDAILEKLRKLLFEKNNRRVALVGLGGIGKTQTALQLAFWTKENKPEYSVFWMPAFSMVGFEQECENLAKKLGIPRTQDNDAKEAIQLHLSSKDAGNWLLIVDNADDMDILRSSENLGKGILDFLPSSEEGRILLTTRSKHVAVTAAKNAVIKLPQMGLEEAQDLFKMSFVDEDDLHDDKSVAELWVTLTEARPDLFAPQPIPQPAHTHDRGLRKTVEQLQRSVTVLGKVSAEDDLDRLDTGFLLAIAYWRQGQYKKIVELLEHVVTTRIKVLAADHPNRLRTEEIFAAALIEDRQYEKAMSVLEGVVAVRNGILPDKSPLRPGTLRRLGYAYQRGGQAKKAAGMIEHVVEIQQSVLSTRNPDLLQSQYLLARTYYDKNQTTKAIKLLERIVRFGADGDHFWRLSKDLLQELLQEEELDTAQEQSHKDQS